jgi:hypothetical protein
VRAPSSRRPAGHPPSRRRPGGSPGSRPGARARRPRAASALARERGRDEVSGRSRRAAPKLSAIASGKRSTRVERLPTNRLQPAGRRIADVRRAGSVREPVPPDVSCASRRSASSTAACRCATRRRPRTGSRPPSTCAGGRCRSHGELG